MDCGHVRERLSAGSTEGLGEHLATCPACAELAADGALLARTLTASPAEADVDLAEGFERLHEAIAADQGAWGRVAGRPTWQRRLLLVLALAAILLLNALATPRADLDLYPGLRMALILAGLGGLGLATGWRALRPLHAPPVGAAGWLCLVGLALVGPLVVGLLPVAHLEHARSFQGHGLAFARSTGACFAYGTVFALMVFALVRLCDRWPRPFLRTRGALLAAALGGIAGNLALQVHCPVTEQAHLLLGHALVGVTLVVVLALAGRLHPRRVVSPGQPRR